ncbi:putative ribonuclease H-like domain-containing protein [Tanacetum coccineum]
MRPFGCHVTILNTLDHLGKFDGKSDDRFFIGYSLNNKAFRLYNIRTRKVEEILHVRFLEDKPIIAGDGPKWLFDIDVLTESMNFVSVVVGTNSNDFIDGLLFDSSSKNASNDEPQPSSDVGSLKTVLQIPTVITAPLEATHADFFRDEIELDMSNIFTTYQKRRMTKTTNEQGFISAVYEGKTHDDLHTCLFACFLSQEEPKRISKALSDSAWVEAMQEELLQNKKNERGIVIRNKAKLVALGYTQEEGIDYDEVFAPVARIEAIRLFLAYASFMGFMVYQMDVKSVFLYDTIEEEVYVCQPIGFEDPDYPDKVYKVVKALYGLHQAPRAWYETLAKYLLDNGFYRGKIDQTLFKKKQKGDILLVHVYVDDIIFCSTKKEMCTEKFSFIDVRTASTPIDTDNPFLKHSDGDDVDVHLYRSIIRSLMYLTSSRLDIMFAVCACARFQVSPKASYLHAVKRIFRYLKGQPKLGLWYLRDSSFDLVAYSDSDYAGASLDRKSTTRGCQFLGYRLISWQCKKQTVVATSSTEVEYVAAASCCGQVWEHIMERAATTASSLEAEQDSGSGPKCQYTILGDQKAQIRFAAASKQSNDPPLLRVNTLGSGEDNIKLKELIGLYEDPSAGPNQGKKTKRRRTRESESSKKPSTTKETPKGKAPLKGSKIGKYASAKEPVKEPIIEVVIDDAFDTTEGDRYLDLSKPLPLQGRPSHLTVAVDYFFNNDLEYLKTFDLEKTYTTSITKTKAAQYEIVGIEDMTPTLWNLHLNDIEDMLIFDVQHKLFHLNDSDIIDFILALHMFTRSLAIKRQVKDLHLGVESYQKKLNITAPQPTFLEIEFKELYTPSYKPPRVIYKDLNKQKRIMLVDELHKFSNGTLKKVQDELHPQNT